MKKLILLNSFLLLIVNTYSQQNKLEATGNVGIGTITPESKFVVLNSGIGVTIGTGSNISGLGFNRSVNGGKIYNEGISAWQFTARDERFSLERYIKGQTSISPLNILKNGYIGIGTKTPDQALVINGSVAFEYNGASASGLKRNGIATEYYNRITGTNANVIHQFTGFNKEIMSITQGGNVGIGTTTPDQALVVKGSIALDYNGSGVSGLKRDGVTTEYYNKITGTNTNVIHQFTGFNKEIMSLTQGGSIGIGTKTPESKFVILDNNIGVTIGTGNNISGLGFNRSVNGGKIYNKEISAWQFTARDERFSLERYINGQTSISPLNILKNGYVGIGVNNPSKIDSKLTVAGKIHSQEVLVTVNAGADFVFENDYNLPSLKSVEEYIKENKHLPEIASAKEMQSKGLQLAEMNIKLLQKVEELTLYTIEQEKKIQDLELLNDKLLEFQSRLEKLESKN